MGQFKGFGGDLFSFFDELRVNNNREWFAENKARYEDDVVTPLLSFIEEMQPRLKKIAPHFIAEPKKQGGSMFRIYRDVRFARDKRPYKEHAACQFRHGAGKDVHAPGFYVHLEPGNILVGGGIWLPPSDTLKDIRNAIAADPAHWSRIVGNKKLKGVFGGIHGDGLSRPPKGFDKDAKHISDIKRKTFFVMRKTTKAQAGRADFLDYVSETFTAARPLMKFLCTAARVDY